MIVTLREFELEEIPELGDRVKTKGILWRSPVTCLCVEGDFQLWRVKGHTRWDEDAGESVVEQAEYIIMLIGKEGKNATILYSENPGRQWYSRTKVLKRVVKILYERYDKRNRIGNWRDTLPVKVTSISTEVDTDVLSIMVEE